MLGTKGTAPCPVSIRYRVPQLTSECLGTEGVFCPDLLPSTSLWSKYQPIQ